MTIENCGEAATTGGRLSDWAAAIGVRNVGCGSRGLVSVEYLFCGVDFAIALGNVHSVPCARHIKQAGVWGSSLHRDFLRRHGTHAGLV